MLRRPYEQEIYSRLTTEIDEISNGVFKVTLTDSYGRKAGIIDNATDEAIEKAIDDAFDIEKQISQNWNLFLFDLGLKPFHLKPHCINYSTVNSFLNPQFATN